MGKVHVIRVAPYPGCEDGLVRIDGCDYDPSKHDLAYIEGEEPVAAPSPAPAEPPATGGEQTPADPPGAEEGDASATSPKTTKKRPR